MAWWVVLLVAGMVVVVAASITLISGSSARTQAAAVEQRYFGPTSASTESPPDRSTKVSKPVESSAPTPKPVSTLRSAPPMAALTLTGAPSSQQKSRPSRPRIAVVPPSVPTSIELAGSSNPIRVIPIGVSAAGVLEPPADISVAGWWVSGPRPGMPGRAVITGHIDSAAAGLGAFAALDLLHPGDSIALTEADGRKLHFEVSARQEVEKTQLDPRILQRTTNTSDLLLVTCIGDFDYATRSYESNLLITAVPVPAGQRR